MAFLGIPPKRFYGKSNKTLREDALFLVYSRAGLYEFQLKNKLEDSFGTIEREDLQYFLAETFHQYAHCTRADPSNLATIRDVLMQIFQEDEEYELIMFAR